jgi:UDP-N-acetyl-D-glucosamine dehydrogenase
LIELLLAAGAEVRYHDPYVPHFHIGPDVFHKERKILDSVALTAKEVEQSDCVVIVSGHTCLDYHWVLQHAPLLVDAPNAAAKVREGRDKVWRIGAPPQS